MAKRRGLARGLDALLSPSLTAEPAPVPAGSGVREVPIDQVERGRFQPRDRFDEAGLEELASSIRARGLVQPVVVRPLEGGRRYELVAGERRWRAAQRAGLEAIPAVVREVDDEEALAIALVENIQREDLNPVEEARALKRLVDDFGLTHQEAAEAVGRSRAAVSNLIRLLELSPRVLELVHSGELEMGHARALLGLVGERQLETARDVLARGLSVRQTEALVRHLGPKGGGASKGRGAKRDPDVERLESRVADAIGAPVTIRHDARGKGTLVIRYTSLDELDGILRRFD